MCFDFGALQIYLKFYFSEGPIVKGGTPKIKAGPTLSPCGSIASYPSTN